MAPRRLRVPPPGSVHARPARLALAFVHLGRHVEPRGVDALLCGDPGLPALGGLRRRLGVVRADDRRRAAGIGPGEDQAADAMRMRQRELLSDPSAHAPSEHVGATDPERVEQRGHVTRHRGDGEVVLRRPGAGADPAVVEHRHAPPAERERLDERGVPGGHGAAHVLDQEQRRALPRDPIAETCARGVDVGDRRGRDRPVVPVGPAPQVRRGRRRHAAQHVGALGGRRTVDVPQDVGEHLDVDAKIVAESAEVADLGFRNQLRPGSGRRADARLRALDRVIEADRAGQCGLALARRGGPGLDGGDVPEAVRCVVVRGGGHALEIGIGRETFTRGAEAPIHPGRITSPLRGAGFAPTRSTVRADDPSRPACDTEALMCHRNRWAAGLVAGVVLGGAGVFAIGTNQTADAQGDFKVTPAQLQFNQKISQAAVRRSNQGLNSLFSIGASSPTRPTRVDTASRRWQTCPEPVRGGPAPGSPTRRSTRKNAPGSVTSGDLANNAVTEAKIAAGAVAGAQLGGAAVTTAKIANEAINSEKIAPGGVTSGDLADSAVTRSKIAPGLLAFWAVVANDGTKTHSEPSGITSTKIGGATYAVTFPAAIDQCALPGLDREPWQPAPHAAQQRRHLGVRAVGGHHRGADLQCPGEPAGPAGPPVPRHGQLLSSRSRCGLRPAARTPARRG